MHLAKLYPWASLANLHQRLGHRPRLHIAFPAVVSALADRETGWQEQPCPTCGGSAAAEHCEHCHMAGAVMLLPPDVESKVLEAAFAAFMPPA